MDIAKADLEAIAGFTDPALEAIERQQAQLLRAGQFEAARALDMQAEKLLNLQTLRQNEVDQAQIALAVMKSRQAQERALLAIQQRRVGQVKTEAGSMKKAATAAGGAAKAALKGGGGAAAVPEGVGAGLQLGEAPDLFSSEAIEKAKAQLKGAFGEGLEASGFDEALSDFTGSTAQLGTELSRIQQADPVGKLSQKFAGLAGAISQPLAAAQRVASSVFGGIQSAVDMLSFSGLIGQIDSIMPAFNRINPATLTAKFATMKGGIQGQLLQLLNPGFILGEGGLFQATFMEGSPLYLVIQKFAGFLVGSFNLATSLISLGLTTFRDSFLTPFFSDVETFFSTFSTTGITTALAGLPASLQAGLVDPFVNALNDVINKVDELIPNQVFIGMSITTGSAGALDSIPPFSELANKQFTIGTTIDLPDNPFRNAANAVSGRAQGGLGVRGMMLVGEQGPELIQASRPVDVFPNGLSEILAAALPILVGAAGGGEGGSVTNNRTVSQQTTINVASPEQASLIQRQQLAFGRR